MLLGQDFRRGQNCALPIVRNRHPQRRGRHGCLAGTDIALKQAAHGARRAQVGADIA